ncbi:MAG: hypothetical protein A2Y14_01675 [Verrucomicrobia bacterium GWF2_51_19]|nr:MAG: hypothetical protein A2Y14_01675 [Verrucomicrobia bacterium GWF2_51_19]
MNITSNNKTMAAIDKVLTFSIGDESYAIDVLRVQEIIRLPKITRLPRMPEYIRGVINLRGKIIPIFDLKVCFGMTALTETPKTCVVILETEDAEANTLNAGFLVDSVNDIVSLANTHLEANVDTETHIPTHYIHGICQMGGTVRTLIDIDAILKDTPLEAQSEAKDLYKGI